MTWMALLCLILSEGVLYGMSLAQDIIFTEFETQIALVLFLHATPNHNKRSR